MLQFHSLNKIFTVQMCETGLLKIKPKFWTFWISTLKKNKMLKTSKTHFGIHMVISVYIWLLFALNTFFWTMLTCPFRLVREHREHKQINKDRFNKLCFSNKQHQMRMPRPLITYIVYTTQHHDQNLGLFILTFQ